MRIPIALLISLIFFAACLSCDRTDGSLDDYAKYGIFKDVYPLQDSVTVDVKAGDSTFIETNKGKLWIKVNYVDVGCYKEIDPSYGCTDLGNTAIYTIRSDNEALEIRYVQEGFPINTPDDKLALQPCYYVTKENYLYLPRFTLGKTNILFRGIYPYPQTKGELEAYNANNGEKLHLILTFQKICN